MKATITGSLAALALGACAYPPAISQADLAEADRPLICTGKAQCEIYWQRAQAWISENSEYKIQTVSDAIIQTHGTFNGSSRLVYIVTRVPSEAGTTRIVVEAGCSGLSCSRDALVAIANFKRFVRDARMPESHSGTASAESRLAPAPVQSIAAQTSKPASPRLGALSAVAEAQAKTDLCMPVGSAVLTGTSQAGDTYRVNCMGGMTREYACAGQSCSPAQ